MLSCELTEHAYVADMLMSGASFHRTASYNRKMWLYLGKGKYFYALISDQTYWQKKKKKVPFLRLVVQTLDTSLECCLRAVKQWRHFKTISTKQTKLLILFNLLFQNRLYIWQSPPAHRCISGSWNKFGSGLGWILRK